MLADAIHAESYRLSRNRGVLFWSVLFVPLASLILTIVGLVVAKANEAKLAASKVDLNFHSGPLDLFQTISDSAAGFANPAVLMFMTVGAATLYAGDYRWETWRLISARNTRSNLVVAKLAVFAGLMLAASLAVLVGDMIAALIQATVFTRPLGFGVDGEGMGRMGLLSLLSWTRILQFTIVGLLTAIVTRSLLAALFVPLVVGVAQALAPQLMMGFGIAPTEWAPILMSPALATDVVQGVLKDRPGLPDQAVLKGVVSLALWTLVPLAAALAAFQRQDLSKE